MAKVAHDDVLESVADSLLEEVDADSLLEEVDWAATAAAKYVEVMCAVAWSSACSRA